MLGRGGVYIHHQVEGTIPFHKNKHGVTACNHHPMFKNKD